MLRSFTYKVLTTTQPSYQHNRVTVQPLRSARSSFLVTLACPLTSSSLRITDSSFRYASPCLWNHSVFLSANPVPISLSLTHLSLHLSVLPLLILHSHHPQLPNSFTAGLNLPFPQILSTDSFPLSRLNSTDSCPNSFFWAYLFLFLVSPSYVFCLYFRFRRWSWLTSAFKRM